AQGYSRLRERAGGSGEISFHDGFFLGLGLALDVFPGVTVLLYRAGRGDRRFGLGPALSQELTEQVYNNPELRRRVMERSDQGIVPLLPEEEAKFRRQAESDLRGIETMLERAEKLPAFDQVMGPVSHRPQVLEESWTLSPPAPGRSLKPFRALARNTPENRRRIAELSVGQLHQSYQKGDLSPQDVLRMILEHPLAFEGSVFSRDLRRGRLHRGLQRLAAASEARFQSGRVRPLEGVFVAVKDLFPGLDGMMRLGSKTALVQGVEPSPVVGGLVELGAIPIPMGMTAAANGGSGLNSGFGYIPHPRRPGFDPAGSSSATAYAIGLPDLPIALGIGTDTGGSVSAPAGAVGLFGFVPPAGLISTENMIPFATFLDRVGVLALHPADGLMMARLLSRLAPGDPHMRFQNPASLYQAYAERPRLAFLASLAAQASPEAYASFKRRLGDLQVGGYAAVSLGSEWNFLSEIPMRIYPYDAYTTAAFAHTNPLRENFWEPPRRTLDQNLALRIPKGVIAMRDGYYDRARRLSRRFDDLVRRKLGRGVVLVSPSAEAIPTEYLLNGKGAAALDQHDRVTMAKNRLPNWGQMVLPDPQDPRVGMAFSGELPDLMQLVKDGFRLNN
ncbi:MAG: amidase family protein, partial [Candidatus Binatia bacterium]